MIKNILWDLDGVILDSMPVRDFGFREIFKKYEKNVIDEFILYHRKNGGLSRFHKIKYFYNQLLKKDITESKIQKYANQFTVIMKNELTNPKYLIQESINFIKSNHDNYNFHIVSGSEHNELNYLCEKLKLKDYFLSINGSPTPKNSLVENLLNNEKYKIEETILIGDSINDCEAANINNIIFYGFNNSELKVKSKYYIDNFDNFKFN